jgi:hypothetical protein
VPSLTRAHPLRSPPKTCRPPRPPSTVDANELTVLSTDNYGPLKKLLMRTTTQAHPQHKNIQKALKQLRTRAVKESLNPRFKSVVLESYFDGCDKPDDVVRTRPFLHDRRASYRPFALRLLCCALSISASLARR